jgi:DNA replication protein DnaC
MSAGCPSCRAPENLAGVGYRAVAWNAHGRPTGVEYCDCMRAHIQERVLATIGQEVPAWMRNLSFDRNPIALIAEPALRRIRGYYNAIDKKVELGKGLWLGGATGTGKTAAAALLATRARRRGITVTFANVPQLLSRLARVRWDDDLDLHEEELHERLSEVPLLVLDDLSASKTSPYAIEQLYLILNRRYQRDGRNATILTTDLERRQLERMFGRRLVRRAAWLAGRPVTLEHRTPPDAHAAPDDFADVTWSHDDDELPEAA